MLLGARAFAVTNLKNDPTTGRVIRGDARRPYARSGTEERPTSKSRLNPSVLFTVLTMIFVVVRATPFALKGEPGEFIAAGTVHEAVGAETKDATLEVIRE